MGEALEQASQSGDGLQQLTKDLKELSSEINTVGKGMVGAGGVMSAVFTAPLAMGTKAAWDQVDAVQQATVALRAYEKDAAAVEGVLQGLVSYAQSDLGVLFQRQDLFAAAQGLKVMGAETDRLVDYVEIMSRSVGIGASRWDELGRVIGRVLATGVLAGNEFDELTKAGYQLDDSLRGAKVTADELFDALDQGIPADAMLGQIDTIDGGLIRLQSGVRNLGAAFLQIEDAAFVSGGLGAQMEQGLRTARDLLDGMVPAAAAFGQAAAIAGEGAGAMVSAFAALPAPAQAAVWGIMALGGAAVSA